jgi:cell wall assembly regulator SMI1
MSIKQQWQRLETLLIPVLPELVHDLRPGLPESQWQSLEAHLGVSLPTSLKEFYAVHNGQEAKAVGGFFFGLEFLPFAEIVTQWEGWQSIIKLETPESLVEDYCFDCRSITHEAIKVTYANSLWIPFAHDWGGNHLGIDLDPDVKGTVGQVINFGRDEEHKVVVAKSFEAFITWFVRELETENYVTEKKEKSWLWYGSAPETHFLDTVKTLFAPT